MLSNYLNANFTDCPHIWTNSVEKTVYKDKCVDSLCTNSIKHRRDVVHSVCSSSQHESNFQETIIFGNEQKHFANYVGL